MATDADIPSTEREKTDESLRTERHNMDRVRLDRQATIERDADAVVHQTRDDEDAVLDAARGTADRSLLEDEALRRERAGEDEVLRRQRQRVALTFATLLAFEREKTDLDLLTERARSDDALANRDDFLGMVSHDLRNLLNGIVVGVGVLSLETPEGESGNRIRRDAERIQSYATRMARLIGDLVDVVSIDAGKLAVTPVRQDGAELIDEAIDAFRGIAEKKNISLTKIEGAPFVAELDRQRLLQVLVNLIGNAIKFTAPGGSVSVHAESKGGEVLFRVRDTGSGIPPTMLESVFDRFWQVGENDRRGQGLGLYISRCIVEAHGGRIWAESEEGKGSEFLFTIPG
ncbi:MAG TPA: HAMP domain-containing sensor histidine kinase [Thermoanaerobaculia bacterium]